MPCCLNMRGVPRTPTQNQEATRVRIPHRGDREHAHLGALGQCYFGASVAITAWTKQFRGSVILTARGESILGNSKIKIMSHLGAHRTASPAPFAQSMPSETEATGAACGPHLSRNRRTENGWFYGPARDRISAGPDAAVLFEQRLGRNCVGVSPMQVGHCPLKLSN